MNCSQCGKRIIGTPVVLNGQNYCAVCGSTKRAQAVQQEEQFKKLTQYICELFNLNDIPTEWIYQLNALIKKENRTPYGLRMTFYYVYEIEGMDRDPDKVFMFIRLNYAKAETYIKKQREISKQNEHFVPSSVARVVTIPRPVNTSRKPNYDISDL